MRWQKACAAIGQPVVVNSVVMRVGATVGVALASGVAKPEALVREAGIALAAGRADGERLRIFDASLHAKDAADLALEAAVRAAVEKGELEVWFQPIVRLRTAQVEAVEALIRWRHPTEGILGPDRFLTTILRVGLSRPLNRLVLSQSISRWPEWRRLGYDLDVSVNLSMADLLDASLPDDIARLLARHRVPAGSLVVEVTESIAMSDSELVRGVIEQLRALGVRVAIDDFGSGFSSLAHLRALPVDEIKLDRQFVAAMRDDEGSAAIVRSVAELSRSLGLVVVAEGVETAEQQEQLLNLGYTFAQGFLFARPMSADDLRERLGSDGKEGIAA
jgi:EAL domain-containing protein (putative c-di-GMP-specific phosphodiesterase class I)